MRHIVRALAADEYSTDEEEVTDEMLEKRDFNKLLKFLIDRGAKIDTIDESADSTAGHSSTTRQSLRTSGALHGAKSKACRSTESTRRV